MPKNVESHARGRTSWSCRVAAYPRRPWSPRPSMEPGLRLVRRMRVALEPGEWACARCRLEAAGDDYLRMLDASTAPQATTLRSSKRSPPLSRSASGFGGKQLILWAIDRWFPEGESLPRGRVRDGVCPCGDPCSRPDFEAVGAELFPEGLRVARRRLKGVPLAQMDARSLGIERAFDVVGAFDVLEHIDHDEDALRAMFAALRPGGGLIVTVPTAPLALERSRRVRRSCAEVHARPAHPGGCSPPGSNSLGCLVLDVPSSSDHDFATRSRAARPYSLDARVQLPAVRINRLFQRIARPRARSDVARRLASGGRSLLVVARRPHVAADERDPVQPAVHDRSRVRLRSRGDRERPPLPAAGRSPSGATAGSSSGRERPGPAHALVHGRSRDGGDACSTIGPGDEVVMPSFTFVSTANAVVVRGGMPVFVDIRPDTLNIDESKVGPRSLRGRRPSSSCTTQASAARWASSRHRGGYGRRAYRRCRPRNPRVVRGPPTRQLRVLSALSFHETKNVHCGEGGALLINDPAYCERAEILLDKGTNRRRFFRGQVDKYTWVTLAARTRRARSTPLPLGAARGRGDDHRPPPGDLDALPRGVRRPRGAGHARRPVVPDGCAQRPHVLPPPPRPRQRSRFIAELRSAGVHSVFHYVLEAVTRADCQFTMLELGCRLRQVDRERCGRVAFLQRAAPLAVSRRGRADALSAGSSSTAATTASTPTSCTQPSRRAAAAWSSAWASPASWYGQAIADGTWSPERR